MNKKELNYAYKSVLKAAGMLTCANLIHEPKDRHDRGEVCPAEYRLARQIYVVQEHYLGKSKSFEEASL